MEKCVVFTRIGYPIMIVRLNFPQPRSTSRCLCTSTPHQRLEVFSLNAHRSLHMLNLVLTKNRPIENMNIMYSTTNLILYLTNIMITSKTKT